MSNMYILWYDYCLKEEDINYKLTIIYSPKSKGINSLKKCYVY